MTDFAASYRATFRSDAGRVALLDMMRRYHVGAVVHVPNDPLETAFRDGQRSVVLDILDMLRGEDQPVESKIMDLFDEVYGDNLVPPPEPIPPPDIPLPMGAGAVG